jgi:hypothetical protein
MGASAFEFHGIDCTRSELVRELDCTFKTLSLKVLRGGVKTQYQDVVTNLLHESLTINSTTIYREFY